MERTPTDTSKEAKTQCLPTCNHRLIQNIQVKQIGSWKKKKKIAINSGSFSYQKAEVTTYLTAPVTLEVLTTCRTNIHLFPLHSDYSNRGCAGVSFKAYFEKSRKLFY